MDAQRNLILSALPADELDRLLPVMRRVPLEVGATLAHQDEPIDDVYFPLAGAISLLVLLKDGMALEPALVGREGMMGFPLGLGDNRSRWQSTVQLPGEALVMSRQELRDFIVGPGHLAPLLTHYAGLLVTFVAQSAACAQFHRLDQRTARWLLLMHDRADSEDFELTQEWLAYLLGVFRPSETNVLHTLRDQGLIELQRGRIRILDRAQLEAFVCECYARVEWHYAEQVQGPDPTVVGPVYPAG